MELRVDVFLFEDGATFPSCLLGCRLFGSFLTPELAAVESKARHLNLANLIALLQRDLSLHRFNKLP